MRRYLNDIGVKDTDTTSLKTKKRNLLTIAIVCSLITPIWAYGSYIAGLGMASITPLFAIPVFMIGIILLVVTKNENYLLNIILFALFANPIAMQWLTGGILKGDIFIFWAFLSPLTALIFREIKKAHFLMVLVVVSIILMGVFNEYLEQWGVYVDKDKKLWLRIVNLSIGSVITYAALQYFVKNIENKKRIIDKQEQRTDELLLNILPGHVAEQLKTSGTTSPALYEGATIIFTDFKDFTQYSELFTPEELIDELARCFEAFDEIVIRHGLEKIKTMGDAYMCVAGISQDKESVVYNAERSILAGMEMAEYIRALKAEKLKEGKAYWHVRVGVHTGDVVAGVVGKKKFVFDIWGDAVNVANRLQTCSEEGRVNISATTYHLVKDYFHCSPRGQIAVKNKGEMDMYFVDEQVKMV